MRVKPKVTLTYGEASITLTIPELRPETVAAIVTDARALVERLDEMATRARVIAGEREAP